MSAIIAAIHWDGRPVDPAVLQAANRCARQRCPDGDWIWTDGAVGLAQADLATLPEDQPGIAAVCGPLRIVASCRIDNRRELQHSLPPQLWPRPATDAALILAAYRAWGDTCVQRLVGDWAFVIWDAQRRRLVAARDLSGARQLYYYHGSRSLIIASDRTQIFQDPAVPCEVDQQQLLEYLTPSFQWFSGYDQGLFRDLHALPAGSTLVAADGQVVLRRFWDWTARPAAGGSEQAVLDQYLHTLEEAVRCRLRARSPVALELSGGLDSSAVACLAARLHDAPAELHTLSLVFDEIAEADERERIQPVLDRYALRSHSVNGDRLGQPQVFLPDWSPQSVVGPHEALASTGLSRLYDVAQQQGCRVVLTGQMGDSLNEGMRGVYFDLLRRGLWSEARRRLRLDWRRFGWRAGALLGYYGLLPWLPLPLLRASLLAVDRWQGPPCALPAFLTPWLRDQVTAIDRVGRSKRIRQLGVRCPAARYTLDQCVTLQPMVALTMNYGQPIERRHPYTDRRLLELVLAMPQHLKWEHEHADLHSAGRWHHRRALAGILPDQVRLGNLGVDFAPVVQRGFRSAAMLRWLLDSPVVHIFEREYVQRERFVHELTTSQSVQSYTMVMLCIEGWLRALAPGGKLARLIPPRAVAA